MLPFLLFTEPREHRMALRSVFAFMWGRDEDKDRKHGSRADVRQFVVARIPLSLYVRQITGSGAMKRVTAFVGSARKKHT